MERYSEYKDSGAQWLGKIPKHWDVIKAKYLWNEVFSFSENGSEKSSQKQSGYKYHACLDGWSWRFRI